MIETRERQVSVKRYRVSIAPPEDPLTQRKVFRSKPPVSVKLFFKLLLFLSFLFSIASLYLSLSVR